MNIDLINKEISNKRYSLYIFISFIISFALYYASFNGPFMLDDFFHIVNNKYLQNNNISLSALVESANTFQSRPLSMYTIYFNYLLDGLNPYGYKLANFLLHFVNFLLIYKLTTLLTSLANLKNAQLISFIVAFIWLIHPFNLSSVSYVIQRMTLLAVLFSLIAMIMYIKARKTEHRNKLQYAISIISVLIPTVLAISSKQSGILIFVYISLIEISFFLSKNSVNHKYKSYRSILITLFTITLLACVLISFTELVNGYSQRSFTLSERLLTQTRVIFIYISNIIFPLLDNMGIYNDHIIISENLLNPVSTLISILTLSIIFLILILKGQYYKHLSFGVLLFFGSHIIESTVLPLELYYEHRNYLASFGIIFFIVTALINCKLKISFKVIISTFYILYLLIILFMRSQYWSSSTIFYNNELRKFPNSYRAHIYAARHLIKNNTDKEILERLLIKASEINYIQIETLILLLNHSRKETYQKIVSSVSRKINNRLAGSHVSENELVQLSKLQICIVTNKCRIDNNTFIGYIDILTRNKSVSAKIHFRAYMIKANHLIHIFNDCKNGLPYSTNAYQYFTDKTLHKSYDSYIIRHHQANMKKCGVNNHD